jgi:hypothetical protein
VQQGRSELNKQVLQVLSCTLGGGKRRVRSRVALNGTEEAEVA